MGNSRNLANLLGTGSTIATAKIADDAITSAKIATDAVVADGLSSSAIAAGDLPTGSILQVKTVINDDEVFFDSTDSTGWYHVGLELSITPTSSSSKILVMCRQSIMYQDATAQGIGVRIYRKIGSGSYSSLTTENGYTSLYIGNSGSTNNRLHAYTNPTVLDSPATTSAVTYRVYGRWWTGMGAGDEVQFQYEDTDDDSSPSRFILMEVAG